MSIQKSLTVTAYENLRIDILKGTLRPTERLRITALSERYEVGATAIREALSRLVSDELVDFEDQKGFAVACVSKTELLDLTQTRLSIECLAARQAVINGDLDWESKLLASFHKLSRIAPPTTPDSATVWAEAHRAFHESIIAGCNSAWLMRLCGLLYEKSERYRNLSHQHTKPTERNTSFEHKQLLDAAIARDSDKLCYLLTEHFNKTTDIIKNFDFSNLPNLIEVTK